MIFDCFSYLNENELFEIRYNYLKDVVDKFYITELDYSFKGEYKGFKFPYKDLDKVVYIQIHKKPYKENWDNEKYQKNSLMMVLNEANEDDIIFLNDLDEIWNKDILKEYTGGMHCLDMELYYKYLNTRTFKDGTDELEMWKYGKVFKKKDINCTFKEARMRLDLPIIKNAGWHYSWVGGKDKRLEKAKCIADRITEDENVINRIKEDKLFKDENFKLVELQPFIYANKYKDLICSTL